MRRAAWMGVVVGQRAGVREAPTLGPLLGDEKRAARQSKDSAARSKQGASQPEAITLVVTCNEPARLGRHRWRWGSWRLVTVVS